MKTLINPLNVLILMVLFTMACGKEKVLAPYDYVKWVEDPAHGLKATKSLGEIDYSLLYKPLEYVIALEERDNSLAQTVFNEHKSRKEGLQYFTFTIVEDLAQSVSLQKTQTEIDKEKGRTIYFSFEMQQDLRLVDGTDTLDCKLFHYESAFQNNGRHNFLLGFEKSSTDILNEKTLLFDGHELESTEVALTIRQDAISQLPTLKLQ